MTLAPGTRLQHYQISAQLGAGGMGEVWLAEDTRLKRKVALKLLPAELTSDAERVRRFEQEAQAASALNHPNIITVYDIGESEAGRFIVMELVAGRTLRTLIAEDNSVETLLALGQQTAKALSAAHAAGITHRDIKPDNIMVREDGYVKVLDFGLARLRAAAESDSEAATLAQQTTPGTVMGTVAYMSPEQARGEMVSHPSDVFALGIVLYELATGRHPFKAETLVGYLHAITLQEPQPLTQWKPELPAGLNDLILRMLCKDARQRPTASEVARELQDIERHGDTAQSSSAEVARVSAAGEAQSLLLTPTTTAEAKADATAIKQALPTSPNPAKTRKTLVAVLLSLVALVSGYFGYRAFMANQPIASIAVLPFENRSGNADSEYLSDGLAESLIYLLSQLPDLKVSPTSSVFRYKGKETDPQIVAKELGVDSVMTGRITQRGDNLTISVNLVDTRNGKSLWGEQYERKMSELLNTQRGIASEITNKLQLKLSGAGEQKLAKQYTTNNEAYQLYLKGRFHFAKRTKEDMLRSVEFFREAIRLDPNFALAYVGVAESFAVMPSYPYMSPKEAMAQAKPMIAKALELDPELPEAYNVAGTIAGTYDWNWTEAEHLFKRSLELDPNLAITHYRYGYVYLIRMGRDTEAIAAMKRAMELEPLSLIQGANYAAVLLYARQFDLALEQARKTYELDPNHPGVQTWMSYTLNAKGMYTESLLISEKSFQMGFQSGSVRGYAYAKSGQRQRAEAVIARFKEDEKTKYVSNYAVAMIYAALGERDAAFAELEKAYQQRDWFLPHLKNDPAMDSLRDDPRYKDLLKRMGLPEWV
jgi:serine/threonine-protein kinase